MTTKWEITTPPPVSGGSGEATPAIAGNAVAGETIAGMAGVIKIGGLVRVASAEPLALTRADGATPPSPPPAGATYGDAVYGDASFVPPSGAIYGDATYGDAVFGPNIANPAIYGKARYGQTLYGVASLQKVGGLTRAETPTPLALTRAPGPDL